jgi:hypothetical protein
MSAEHRTTFCRASFDIDILELILNECRGRCALLEAAAGVNGRGQAFSVRLVRVWREACDWSILILREQHSRLLFAHVNCSKCVMFSRPLILPHLNESRVVLLLQRVSWFLASLLEQHDESLLTKHPRFARQSEIRRLPRLLASSQAFDFAFFYTAHSQSKCFAARWQLISSPVFLPLPTRLNKTERGVQ